MNWKGAIPQLPEAMLRDLRNRGTEDRPIVIRTAGEPCKYQCPVCQRWFVESGLIVMFRELDSDVRPRCQQCHDKGEQAEWDRLAGIEAKEWTKYGG